MAIDVADLLFDDANEAKFAAHGITVADVMEVFDNRPKFYENRSDRRASHVMLGPTWSDRLVVVPIEPMGNGIWRPVTAFYPTLTQAARYRRR